MAKSTVFLLFPHQLFEAIEPLRQTTEVYLIEADLFFNQYKFHKQKLVFHRASMTAYAAYLQEQQLQLNYIDATDVNSDLRKLLPELQKKGVAKIVYYDVCDYWLEKRLLQSCANLQLETEKIESPLFLQNSTDLQAYFADKSKYLQHDFYIKQRKSLGLLLDENNQPQGRKWSLDAENRRKYPQSKKPPELYFPDINPFYRAAKQYVELNYPNNYGVISDTFIYPTTHAESVLWLRQFLEQRFKDFGEYEDAMVANESVLHHSVLSPMLNVGLLLPRQIIDAALAYAATAAIPLNTMEGFIRQIIGWREFVRGVYVYQGKIARRKNYWQFKRKIPASFYTATTGILPIDTTIKKVMATGYAHHIERLMLLGNFMLLCEFDPDEVYQWFMELFVDAYDWVMVPNVYGMSQFADGGIFASKPYISGSSYVLKMSNYAKGDWCAQWDALFWYFMDKQRNFFLANPRLAMLVKVFDKMDPTKKAEHLRLAHSWFAALDEQLVKEAG